MYLLVLIGQLILLWKGRLLMKASDYIVEFLIKNGITDVFGYPGGMVTHIMDSLGGYKDKISTHITYHEQGASFAACGYAQITNKPGVAFATSGPGATNLITGIANAFFDSIPCIFITGQVNTYESKGDLSVRQKGFQETDIISMVKGITNYSAYISSKDDLQYHLEKAYFYTTHGRPGPAVLDIPMDIQRQDISSDISNYFIPNIIDKTNYYDISDEILDHINNSKRPCILVGSAVHSSNSVEKLNKFINSLNIPVVSSMIATDAVDNKDLYYGFIGAYGHRCANFIINKSDCILTLGSRLDIRQIGAEPNNFAPNAKLLRIDIDSGELSKHVKSNEFTYNIDLYKLLNIISENKFDKSRFNDWRHICKNIKDKLKDIDNQPANTMIQKISELIPETSIITTDVGQNQVWVAQSFSTKKNRMLYSGGHGAMGYSLPAAIGACYGAKRSPVFAFMGDGGLQMNIQELQVISRDKLPIKIILLNNNSLGMIRHFQEMYFESKYHFTKTETGYSNPDFQKISDAYGIPYFSILNVDEIENIKEDLYKLTPSFIECKLSDNTFVFPKLSMGKPIHDQDPLLNRSLFEYLSDM